MTLREILLPPPWIWSGYVAGAITTGIFIGFKYSIVALITIYVIYLIVASIMHAMRII